MPDVKKNIIFQISSQMGPGGLASLKAGFDMVGAMVKKVIEAGKHLDEFAQIWRSNSLSIKEADTATKGLIDTMQLLDSANRLQRAGVKMNAEDLKNISLVVTKFAQATGQHATPEMEKFTTALVRGRVRALRDYGIELAQTSDLAKAHADVLKAVREKAKGVEVEYETMTERMFALNNNWDTFLGLTWEAIGQLPKVNALLDDLNIVLAEVSNEISEGPESWGEYYLSMERAVEGMMELGLGLAESMRSMFDDIRNEATGLGFGLFDILSVSAGGMTKKQGQAETRKWFEELKRRHRDIYNSAKEDEGKLIEARRKAFAAQQDPIQTMRVGRGGRKEKVPGRPTEAAISQLGFEEIRSSVDARLEALRVERDELEKLQEAEVTRFKMHGEWALAEEEQHRMRIWRIEYETEVLGARKVTEMEMLLGIEQEHINASNRLWQSGLQGKLQLSGVFFNSLAQLQVTRSKAMFQIGKAAAISEAAVNTALGAIKAYQAMAGIPYVGPILGAIAAAAVTAAGAASIAQIRAQKFGGGGGGVASIGGASPSEGGTDMAGAGMGGGASTTFAPSQQEPQEVMVNIVVVDENNIFEAVMSGNDQASRRGGRSLMVR